MTYETYESAGVPIKAWTRGVRDRPWTTRSNSCGTLPALPFIHAAALGSHARRPLGPRARPSAASFPTVGAIVPAAVGVDIGCGMCAVQHFADGPSDLPDIVEGHAKNAIEHAVPHGRTSRRPPPRQGRVERNPQRASRNLWKRAPGDRASRRSLCEKLPRPSPKAPTTSMHLGTLGNRQPLHRGLPRRSRRRLVHAALGIARRRQPDRVRVFIALAKRTWSDRFIGTCRTTDLAYLPEEGSEHFDDYVEAVEMGAGVRPHQPFSSMMESVVAAVRQGARRRAGAFDAPTSAPSTATTTTWSASTTSDATVWVTRKGAVRAARAISASSPARWEQRASSCVARATPTASSRARTAPVA